MKSPGLFKEYYRNPAATAEARSADGWFHTGDAGYLDTDGQLKIIDRAKDVELANGSLFAPKYIENKLKFFQHIKEAVAFGADRDDVCAFINIDLEAVGNWADQRDRSPPPVDDDHRGCGAGHSRRRAPMTVPGRQDDVVDRVEAGMEVAARDVVARREEPVELAVQRVARDVLDARPVGTTLERITKS